MRESLQTLNQAQLLAETGRFAAVLEYLGDWPEEQLEESPTLALLCGIANGRLGIHATADRWLRIAVSRSQDRGDKVIEVRALNASGALAFESGEIEASTVFFTRALAEAERIGDHATVGRCSNNLGNIASLRGESGRAMGSYTMAIAAFQQANLAVGIAEALHNLAIMYRDEGDLENALESEDRAIDAAEEAGNAALATQARVGRAETRVLGGDAEVARREIERGLEVHRELGDVVAEAEDLRVRAGAVGALGHTSNAERIYVDVIRRAELHERPLLAAQAERDLARLLNRTGMVGEAQEHARTARVRFKALGAEAEIAALDQLIGE